MMATRRSTRLNSSSSNTAYSTKSVCDDKNRYSQQNTQTVEHICDDTARYAKKMNAKLDNKENLRENSCENVIIKSSDRKMYADASKQTMLRVQETPTSLQKTKRKSRFLAPEIAEESHTSPTKQPRASAAAEEQTKLHMLSPSSAIDSLSLRKRNSQRGDCVDSDDSVESNESEPQRVDNTTAVHAATEQPIRTKLQIARSVLNNVDTHQLIGREKELAELSAFMQNSIETKTAGSVYISGQPGTGKTACLSLLMRRNEIAQRSQPIYINCTSVANILGVFKKICAELKIVPEERSEAGYTKAIQHYLVHAKKMVLLVLDEVDQLCTFKSKVLYTIFEWPALRNVQLLLVAVANYLNLTERVLPRLNARKQLKPMLMHFAAYDKQQIVEILRSRLEQANVLDVFPAVTLQLLAAKVSAVNGDIRRALDIGRRVAESAAEQQKKQDKSNAAATVEISEHSNDKVKPAQVAQVLNKVYGGSENLNNDAEDAMPLQQKLMLCSLLLMRRHEANKAATLGRLFDVYRRICRKRNMPAIDQTEFVNLIELVETRGIVQVLRKKEPRQNKVQLQWDEDEVTAALKDMNLISSIIQDKSYLS